MSGRSTCTSCADNKYDNATAVGTGQIGAAAAASLSIFDYIAHLTRDIEAFTPATSCYRVPS
jgi:hypothetical protein